MRWESSFYKKWITPAAVSKDFFLEDNLINKCMLVVRTADKKLRGFTVLEPRHVNAEFFKRLQERMAADELASAKIELYAPEYLMGKLSELQKEFPREMNVTKTSFLNVRFKQGILYVRPKLRVVNVDDSQVLLKFLHHTLTSCGWIEIMAQISQPTEAAAKILHLEPDLVTLDIQMPQKNGVEVLKELLPQKHYPVIIVSGLNLEEGSLVFEALMGGAFDYIQKPSLEERAEFREALTTRMLQAMVGKESATVFKAKTMVKTKTSSSSHPKFDANLLWCLGSSTGGTQALTRVLTSLPEEIPPILIVQHIPPVFSKAFADSVNELCPFTVKEAVDGELVQANHVYVAPGGRQMSVIKQMAGLVICLNDDPPVNRFKPSVDYLFSRVARIRGMHVVAGVLTGMGKDGAEGLLQLRQSGAHTFAQDQESSAVYGMPRAAAENGAASKVCHLDQVAETLLSFSEAKRLKAS